MYGQTIEKTAYFKKYTNKFFNNLKNLKKGTDIFLKNLKISKTSDKIIEIV